MGSSNSGRWGWHRKKKTVEECLKIDIARIKRLIPRAVFSEQTAWEGQLFTWKGLIAFSLEWDNTEPQLILNYTLTPAIGIGREMIEYIPMQSTACHYGGRRYWFTCPECDKRAGCLYMPYGTGRFLCRACHDLSYRSSQEAHYFDSLSAAGIDIGYIHHAAKMHGLWNKYSRREWLTRRQRYKLADWLGVKRFVIRNHYRAYRYPAEMVQQLVAGLKAATEDR